MDSLDSTHSTRLTLSSSDIIFSYRLNTHTPSSPAAMTASSSGCLSFMSAFCLANLPASTASITNAICDSSVTFLERSSGSG